MSHRDDERPSGVTSCDMADGVGRLTQRVCTAYDRRDLSGLGQFLEGYQVGSVLGFDRGSCLLANDH